MSFFEKHIFVCENERDPSDPRGCCQSRGAAEFTVALKKMCKDAGIANKVRVNKAGCLDKCAFGPVVVVYPEGTWYKGVSVADAKEIFEQHIVGNTPVERLRLNKQSSNI